MEINTNLVNLRFLYNWNLLHMSFKIIIFQTIVLKSCWIHFYGPSFLSLNPSKLYKRLASTNDN